MSSDPLSNSGLSNRLSSLSKKADSLTAELIAFLSTSDSPILNLGPSLASLPTHLSSIDETLRPLSAAVSSYHSHISDVVASLESKAAQISASEHEMASLSQMSDVLRSLLFVEGSLCLSSDRPVPVRPEDDLPPPYFALLPPPPPPTSSPDYDLAASVALRHDRASCVLALLLSQLRVCGGGGSSSSSGGGGGGTGRLPSSPTAPPPASKDLKAFVVSLAPRLRAAEAALSNRADSLLSYLLRDRVRLSSSPSDPSSSVPASPSSSPSSSRSSSLPAIMASLRTLHALRRVPSLEATFALHLSLPLSRPLLTPGSLHYGGARGECANLGALLKTLAGSVERAAGDIIAECERTFPPNEDGDNDAASKSDPSSPPSAESSSSPSLSPDLLTNGVWSVALECLTSNPTLKSAVFNPGVASVWSANYRCLTSFLSTLPSDLMSPSGASFAEIKAASSRLQTNAARSPVYGKLWNLPIYYQLRFAEAAQRVTAAIDETVSNGFLPVGSVPSALSSEAQSPGFSTPLFQSLYASVLFLWREDVVVLELSSRFAKGTLTIIRRVLAWIFDGLETGVRIECGPTTSGAASAAANAGSGKAPAQDKLLQQGSAASAQSSQLPPPPLSNSSLAPTLAAPPSAGSAPAPGGRLWFESVDDLAVVAWDLSVLSGLLSSDVATTIVKAMTTRVADDQEDATVSSSFSSSDAAATSPLSLAVESLLSEPLSSLPSLIDRSWSLLVTLLVSQCVLPFSSVRGVAALYRLTNRPPPSSCSPFMLGVLRPLESFKARRGAVLPLGRAWKLDVAKRVYGAYEVAVADLLRDARAAAEALRKRQLGGGGGQQQGGGSGAGAVGGKMSDENKMVLQLWLDLQELERGFEKVDVFDRRERGDAGEEEEEEEEGGNRGGVVIEPLERLREMLKEGEQFVGRTF